LDFKPFKIGKYLLLERLAMGGMAEVYRAKASGAGGFEKQLAIKRILPNYSQNEEFRRMFEYEARLSSMLTHSNIVQVYDFVKSGETYLLAMEYVDGKNLRQFVNKVKKVGFQLPVEFGVYIINEVCKGLEYAHKKKDDLTGRPLNIIHRDMSPQNVMLSYEGAVKIVDFGIAKAKDRADETRSGVIKGKFGYMSPEQACGEPVDHRTDIFSTGIILHELLTSKRLFATENDMATLKLIQECLIPPPSRTNPKVQAELEKIALKALTKDLSLRYQSAGNFHRNLQEFMNKYYPSFTAKDIGDLMARVFKEEIAAEKRRFEQIYRQSIPFSQGAAAKNEDPEEEDSGNSPEVNLDEDMTKSEQSLQTAVTYVGSEAGVEGEGESDVHRNAATQISQPGLIARENTASEPGVGQNTSVEPLIIDETSISTLGEDMSWDPKRESQVSIQREPTSAGTNTGTADPTIANTRATPTNTVPSNEKTQVSRTIATNAGTGTGTGTGTGAGPSTLRPLSGVSIESRNEDTNGPTESSINQVSSISRITDLKSVIGASYNDATRSQSQGTATNIRVSPTERVARRPPKDEFLDDMRSPFQKLVGGVRTLMSVSLLLGILSGTIYLYQLYLDDKTPKIISEVIKKIEQAQPDRSSATETVDEPSPIQVAADCTLFIESEPSAAVVFIGEVERGVTPTTLPLDCKKAFNITLKRDGFETQSENIFIKEPSGKMYRTLKKIPQGQLELTLTQSATIEIKEINFSIYAKANQPVSIDLRANRPFRVRFKNEILGIDTTQEFTVSEGSILRRAIRLGD